MTRHPGLFPIAIIILAAAGCAPEPSLKAAFAEATALYDRPGEPGGVVFVARGDSILLESAFGLADPETNRPNTPETCFRLASVSKQFTAMSILILADRGTLRLDQPLTDFFPQFSPVGKRVTVRHLLTHTSGLVAYEDVMPDTTTIPLLDNDVLTLVAPVDSTSFAPGTRYRYSNTGYALLSLIVERIAGISYPEFLQREIFRPIGMSRTLALEHGKTDAKVRAFGYNPPDSGQTGLRRRDQSTTSHVLGDGGIYSCVGDLWEWHHALLRRPPISGPLLDSAFTEHAVSDDGSTRYGYGWMLGTLHGHPAQFHSGSTTGFRTFLLRVPDVDLFVVVLMNRGDGPSESIARRLADIALGQG